MPVCEMCGKDEEKLYKTAIEGTDLNVCEKCSSYGKVKAVIIAPAKDNAKPNKAADDDLPKIEVIQIIVPNFGELVKNAREKKGLKQEDVAKLVRERETVIQKVESGAFVPSITLAQKLERFFKIKLIEEHEEKHGAADKRKDDNGPLTIGDIIKVRKK